MKEIGYYYSRTIKTLIIGYKNDKGNLVGKVIGNTFDNDMFAPFSFGYKYDHWHEGFTYLGKLTNYTTLKGYLDFIDEASYEKIKDYFSIKTIVLDQHNSYIKKRKIGDTTIKCNMKKI